MRSEKPASQRTARAIFRACSVPCAEEPYDRVALKIFYPALRDDGEEQRNTGLIPADGAASPYPVVIMMPGINVGPESYFWLASDLAQRGIITVTYSMIAEEMPGYISLTPGLDLGAITPETWGTKPSGTAIAPIIAALENENENGVLKGCIDLDNIVLAGHSAGGSVAMYNARTDWFPRIRGALAYAAHAAASTALGFAENTVLDLANSVPIAIIGGTRDGVIASSAHRYGQSGDNPPDRLLQTFEEGIATNRSDSYLIYIDGANHFSLAHPVDESTGRHFLDQVEQGDGEAIRALLADLFEAFVLDTCRHTGHLDKLESQQLVSKFRCR